MIDEGRLRGILAPHLAETGAFLVDLKLQEGQQITVEVDTLSGIRLEQLSLLNRRLVEALGEEIGDWELTFTSPGVGQNLRVAEQYQQNVGRRLKVTTLQGDTWEGRLERFANDELLLVWKERVPKDKGKGKQTVQREIKVNRKEIREARVLIEFK